MTVPKVIVVGIGADGLAGLAPSPRAELQRAVVVYGSRRQLDLLDATVGARREEWPSPLSGALEQIRNTLLGPGCPDVHIVASGDPMLHGIGAVSVRVFGPDRVTVYPHVSSVTLACARIGWSVQDTEVISFMTAGPRTAVRRGGQAVVLSRDGTSPAALAALLTETGRGDSEFTVLEQLGGPGERCRTSTARAWAADPPDDIDALNVVAVRYLPDERQFQVLPDAAFDHDGQITKQTIRAVTMAALAPRPGQVLWDVGAGSGSVAIEWCRSGSGCRAVAFEQNEIRRQRITDNAIRHGIDIPVHGGAPESFARGGTAPHAIFVGGGASDEDLLNRCFAELRPRGTMVVNSVTAESDAALLQQYSRRGGQLRRFQHYQGEPLGKFTGWRPAMPISQWIVTKG
jgi:precorrin-6Y C5,15-methyltransferase (decarboxylating)